MRQLWTIRFATLLAILSAVAVNGAPAAVVNHYLLDGDGVDAVGASDGTVGGNVTFSAGDVGQAASFGVSGSDTADRIDVPQASAFNPGSADFSYVFWVKRDQNDTGNADGVSLARVRTSWCLACSSRCAVAAARYSAWNSRMCCSYSVGSPVRP